MVTSQINKDSNSLSVEVDNIKYKDNGGACNVCAAPCSSCFHISKVLLNSTDERTGETCANNVIADRGKQLETENLGEMSTLSGIHSKSDVLSENAVAHSKFDGMKVPEGPDDCSSYAGGADELTNRELLVKEASLDVCAETTAMPQKPIKENGSMEVEIKPSDETDDSEMEEQDVKVCDICGDAGREELLAVCSQCSDGAEHTYCMRDMLEELPEGDWLCEECRSAEQVEMEKQVGYEKEEKIEGYEKNSSSGQVSIEHVNNSDAEGQRAKGHMKTTGKRLRDDADVEVSSVKKPATDSVVKSPKTTPSSRIATLSREFSLKNPDKNGVVNSKPESTAMASDIRGKDFRGTFSKSNSFNSLNSKPKVKLVDQVVFQRQKSAREHSFRHKEGLAKSKVKSTSFKSLNPGRSESKTDMLSPRPSRINDSKNAKQRSSYERQSSFRNDHPSTETGMGTSLGATKSEKKPVRPSSNLGDFKRPSLHSRTTGDNTEEKHNHISPKDDFSLQKALSKANDALPDGLSRPKDSSNVGGRSSGGRFPPPGAKSSVGENDALKAALNAAVLRKPGLYRKHRDIASQQGHVSKFTEKKQISFPEGVPERQAVLLNPQADSIKQDSVENMKRFSLVPVEGLSTVGGLDGKYFLKDMCSNIPAVMPLFCKSSATPEQEYIWQGSFEIFRGGSSSDLCDGLQAHLSTLASHNVKEAVNKFSSKVVLHEVPRLSSWPVQFQENGVREDNIALFFFARDLESYDKIYKVMLDNMMKNDLALKGNINGVELLIFSSNQLPLKAQRWNMFFFLWAVFRVTKESCLQSIPESAKHVPAPSDIPPAIMSVPESRCSVGPSDCDFPVTYDTAPVHNVSAAEKLCNIFSSTAVNGDCDAKYPSLDRSVSKLNTRLSAPVLSDDRKQCQEPVHIANLRRSTRLQNEQGGRELNDGDWRRTLNAKATGSAGGSGRGEILMHVDTPVNRQQSSHSLNEYGAASCDISAGKRIRDDSQVALEIKTFSNTDELQLRNNGGALSPNRKTPLVGSRDVIDLNMECVEPQSPLRTCQVLCGNDDVSYDLALEKIENQRDGACNIHDYKENGWKAIPLEEDRLHDRAPSLELALGAETTPLSQGILPLLLGKTEKRVNEERVPDEVVPMADDEVSASLSLSLSFPFPEKEHSRKPGGSSGRERPTLFFGSGFRDNDCRD